MKNKATTILLSLLALMLLIITSFVLSNGGSPGSSNNSIATLSKILASKSFPLIFSSVIGGIFLFLVVDRWRRIESEMSSLREGQFQTLNEIKSQSQELVESKMSSTHKSIEAIEGRLTRLLQEHPWIVSITDNEFVPDIPSCRMILRTCEGLLEDGQITILYEYLYSWFNNSQDIKVVRGTHNDFLELAEFCEWELADDFLGYSIIQSGIRNASNAQLLIPDLLLREIRHGRLQRAKVISARLKRLLQLNIAGKIKTLISSNRELNKARFTMRAYYSLGYFEAVGGRNKNARKLFLMSEKLAQSTSLQAEVSIVKAEMLTMLGKLSEAENLLKGIDTRSIGLHLERKISIGLQYIQDAEKNNSPQQPKSSSVKSPSSSRVSKRTNQKLNQRLTANKSGSNKGTKPSGKSSRTTKNITSKESDKDKSSGAK